MTSDTPEPLEFTGERFTPECVREISYEHVHRYVLAAELARGRNVLDAACGEGYGARLMAGEARAVTGVDVSPEAISHAAARYQAQNLRYREADCRFLPFSDGEFNCIVSFETIEHLEDQERLLSEFRRVLSADGFLLISSPDKAVYTDLLGNSNPHHVRELYRPEFESLLAREFPAVRILGHALAFHSMIWPLEPEPGVGPEPGTRAATSIGAVLQRENQGVSTRLSSPRSTPVYLMALCAAEPGLLPRLPGELWLFDDAEESVYRHYQHEIRKNMQAGTLLAERDREITRLKEALGQATQPAAPRQEVREPRKWWRWITGGR